MFKKYKAFMNNEGKFEQPGVRALQDFVSLHDRQLRLGHAALAVKAAERRVLEAEEAAREAEARAVMAETFADGQSSLGSGSRSSRETVRRHTRSLRSRASDETGSLVSGETVTRERLFLVPERLSPPPSKPVPSIPTPARTCVLCFDHCFVCPNPWQRTRSDFMVSKAANIGYQKPVPYGLVLQPCGHVFCGACLAQAIYQSLNMAFDRATYGTKLPSYAPDVVGPDRPEFPISCPVCHTRKHGKQREMREIDDTTARLVLGELNMDEWNHARFLSKLRRIHCPHQGCNHNFDADDAIPSSDLPPNEAHVHCPRCKGPLCRPCKSIWHDGLTCLLYQASAPYDPTPADFVRRKEGRKHGWPPMIRTHNRDSYNQDLELYSPGSMHSLGSSDSLSPGLSPNSPGESPYTPGESPDRPGAPPWAHEKESHLPYA